MLFAPQSLPPDAQFGRKACSVLITVHQPWAKGYVYDRD